MYMSNEGKQLIGLGDFEIVRVNMIKALGIIFTEHFLEDFNYNLRLTRKC